MDSLDVSAVRNTDSTEDSLDWKKKRGSDVARITRRRVSFLLGAGEHPVDVAFDPRARYAAATSGQGVKLFQASTGRPVEGKVDFGQAELIDVRRLAFSPSGKYVLVDFGKYGQRRTLRAFPVR